VVLLLNCPAPEVSRSDMGVPRVSGVESEWLAWELGMPVAPLEVLRSMSNPSTVSLGMVVVGWGSLIGLRRGLGSPLSGHVQP
jgi:ABC-type proline/glycine betaine transport system permease subunit